MENPFKKNNSKTFENIPLSQSGILFPDNSSNNIKVSNPFQPKYESGAKVKKLSGYETYIEPNPIEPFDPLAQSANFQNYSYKNDEVIVRPPIIKKRNLQQNNFTNTGNYDFLGEIKTETINQTYENYFTDLNNIHSSPLEQYATGNDNNYTDINNFNQNTNFGNETESNSVKVLPTIYADKNNLSNILNQLKDNKDVNYDNNYIYSEPIYTNSKIENLNPFMDTGKLISETQNLNLKNNILQPITNFETENLNIPGFTSTPINNNFSTENINTDFPIISNPNTNETLQTNFAFGTGTNVEDLSTNFNIGNEIIQNSSSEESENILTFSGRQDGIFKEEKNIGFLTPTSNIDEYIPGKNIIDNNFLLNNVVPKQKAVLPITTYNLFDIKNQQLKEEILKPIYINKINNQIPFKENIISTNYPNYYNNTYQTNDLNLNQSQKFDINKSQNINISQSFSFPVQEQKILPTFTNESLPYEIKTQNINTSNTYPINSPLTTSNTYQLDTDNIDINSSLSVDELRKKYRTETEIVPVEEIEYIPVKKLKYVKRVKVYVPKVKKIIVPKKIVVPIKKTIYVPKPQNNNTITLPTRTFYNKNSFDYIPSNNITYTNNSYQLPYSSASNELPYSSSSNQLPYSSHTEYDNDSVEHAIPIEEKEIESKMEEIRPIKYMSPVRTPSKYIPQSPDVSFNYTLNQNTHYSRFQTPLRKSHIYTGNIYTPRTYRARSLSSQRK